MKIIIICYSLFYALFNLLKKIHFSKIQLLEKIYDYSISHKSVKLKKSFHSLIYSWVRPTACGDLSLNSCSYILSFFILQEIGCQYHFSEKTISWLKIYLWIISLEDTACSSQADIVNIAPYSKFLSKISIDILYSKS